MPHDPEFVRIVEAQGRRPVGIPVLLFTDATLAATDDATATATATATEETAGQEAASAANVAAPVSGTDHDQRLLRRAAETIGIDIADVELFTTDAYLLQSVAGHLTVEQDA